MVLGRPGLDIPSLVRDALVEAPRGPSRLAREMTAFAPPGSLPDPGQENAYDRLFSSPIGQAAANRIGNESLTLDLLSSISLELLFTYVDRHWSLASGGRRVLAVANGPVERPVLLVLDPALSDVAETRRVTDELPIQPAEMMADFGTLSGSIAAFEPRLADLFSAVDTRAALHLLAISQPEIIVTRRPRTVPLCVPSPYVQVQYGGELSSAGVFCRDADGELGVTACRHGTGPVGDGVEVAGTPAKIKHAHEVQDIVFIPLGDAYALPQLCGRGGVRTNRAPSQAEHVAFDGAGSGARVTTRVQSHDAGIMRRRATVQLKLQTPAITNPGDSGSALVDLDDRIVGFGFERTGLGEYPEFTDWIWADNALAALGLTPL